MTNQNLRPCPYCGASGDNVQVMGSDDWFWVGCIQCQCAGPFGRTETEAKQKWDNRK